MQKAQILSPISSMSSISVNSVDYKSLNDSQEYVKINNLSNNKNNNNKKNDANNKTVLPPIVTTSKPRYPYILENDQYYKNGKRLLIRGKDLKQLNENIFKSNSDVFLTSLELSPDRQSCLDYRLEKLPKNINLFKNLRELKLDTNDLTELPFQIGDLNRLERLSLSNNHIKALPEQSFIKLVNLKSLHLTNNQFEVIPSCIFSLKSLEFLDLTSNKIKIIDKNISKLQNNLKALMVYDNLIEDINNVCELKFLEVFWFGKNKVKCFPLNLTNIKTLDWKNKYLPLILDNNPLNEPPLNICKKGFDDIKNWYNDKKNNKTKEVNKNSNDDYRNKPKPKEVIEEKIINIKNDSKEIPVNKTIKIEKPL